ncbi:hypothetical protein ACFPAG_08345 [Vogesella sp. GCM10023246]|uniref:Restriction endonuclease n=1 Tax=Vogesella oryzagri TaxID=3160864 RepID=A0ABV1M311_9NEIS
MNQPKNLVEQINAMSSDDISKFILECMGLRVEKLEEPGDRKEADFLAYYESEIFIIEAKLKVDDEKELSRRERVLTQGEVYVKDDVLGRDNTVSGALSNARDQLISSAKVHRHDLRIIFHLSKGINVKAKYEKTTDPLLGRTNIIDMTTQKYKPCYFFRYSDFYKFRHAFDAAIVGYVDGHFELHANLYANPHSPRYEKTKKSKFLARYKCKDPMVEEAQGRAYIPDANISIRESEEVLNHLRIKYKNAMLEQIDFFAPEITIRVANE